MVFKTIIVIVSVLVQILASCSSESNGDNVSSSSYVNYSSSRYSSSSSEKSNCGDFLNSDGDTVETVIIGNQVWMAKNLNVAHNAGNGNSWCYEGYYYPSIIGSEVFISSAEGYARYGRLYNWAAAMDLPSSCNSISCVNQIQAKHRGICPAGFHIPSNADWDELLRYVDGDSGTTSPYNSPTAGVKLKAISGWVDLLITPTNGTDDYGFSALPGGLYNGRSFDDAVYDGYWWSASESSDNTVYYRIIGYNNNVRCSDFNGKSFGLSVRCIQDMHID